MTGSNPNDFAGGRAASFLEQCRVAATGISTDPGPRAADARRRAGDGSGRPEARASAASCLIEQSDGGAVEAEVVGFAGDRLFLMPISDIHGLTPGAHR